MSSKFGRERVEGFLHAEGTRIVNGKGEEIILEGYGTGNWMNQEGFMIGGPDMSKSRSVRNNIQADTGRGFTRPTTMPLRFDRHRTVSAVVKELCGEAYLKTFWQRWYQNHLSEADIKAMADLNLNCVRLVLNASVFLKETPDIQWDEEGFKILEQVIDWCEKYHIYAILDMHAAPGGQSGCMFDDGYDSMPRMFYEEEFRNRSILLWTEIARRYADRYIVGGYDLLNEPISIPDDKEIVPELAAFYDDCIAAIRKVDKNHMFFLEGAGFARNIRTFDHHYDPECHNWAIHLHKYGFSPEIKDLYPYLIKSRELNVPIWIGEGGSSSQHNAVFYNMASEYGIGYCLWCWKTAIKEEEKDTASRCVHHILPEKWDKIQSYLIGGVRPDYQEAMEIFDEYLENMKYEKCVKNFEHINITRRKVPFTLPAAGYVHDPVNGRSFSSNYEFGNYLNYRLEDHTRLVWDDHYDVPIFWMDSYPFEPKHDPLEKLLLKLLPGEFTEYELRDIPFGTVLVIEGRSAEGAVLKIDVDKEEIKEVVFEGSGKENRKSEEIPLPKVQEKKLRISCVSGDISLKALHFSIK